MLYRRAVSPLVDRPPARRLPALDVARALGVVAMVFGHTLDALLAPEVRETAAVVAYWKARGLTAPLFLLVSGWAVTIALGRSRARGLAAVRARLPRVLLLLAVGYALRWPGWNVDALRAGDPLVWSHLAAFDALHVIGVALLLAAAVLAAPVSRTHQAIAFAAAAALAVALGQDAPFPPAPVPADFPAAPLAIALAQAAGGTSPFPLFPWLAYFFAGGLVGLATLGEGDARAAGGGARARGGLALVGVGGALVAATCWTGVGSMPPGQPLLVLFRVGVVLVLLGALSAAPARLAAAVAPLGRASLGVYAIHVPIVYGWSTRPGLVQRVGPTLGLAEGLAAGALVLAASLALHLALVTARDLAVRALERLRAAAAARGEAEPD